MIPFKDEYYRGIESRGVGSKDRVAPSPDSYVSYLNSVSQLIGEDIPLAVLSTDEDIEKMARSIEPLRAPKTVRNYQSAMRLYVAMVRAGIRLSCDAVGGA